MIVPDVRRGVQSGLLLPGRVDEQHCSRVWKRKCRVCSGCIGPNRGDGRVLLPCPVGSYCVAGVQYLCPAGKWGNNVTGASTVCANNCSNGYLWYA